MILRPYCLVLLFANIYAKAADTTLRGPTAARAPKEAGAVATGNYQNLFVTQLKLKDIWVESRIEEYIWRMFEGDLWTDRLLFEMADDKSMAYIYDTGMHFISSESISYGMMIAVQLDKKEPFDKIWKWANKYMRNQQGPCKGYFAWKVVRNMTVMDDNAAPDAEFYMATALIFASKRWGDGQGIFAYSEEATKLLSLMIHHETSPMFTQDGLVKFSPKNSFWTNPSYHLPAFFEVWVLYLGKKNAQDAAFYSKVAEKSRELLRNAADPVTGLSPDWCDYEGREIPLHEFSYDAWRVIQNIAVDWSWWKKDPWQRTYVDKSFNFFESQGISTYKSEYFLDGVPYPNAGEHQLGLVAMNAVGALAATNQTLSSMFLWDFWNQNQYLTDRYRYYSGLLRLFGFLHCSGIFKVYLP